MILIFKPWYEEEYKSERRKLGKYVIISTILVQVIQMLFRGFLLYDLFLSIITGVVTYIFYKIFANSLIVISEFDIKKAFTVEEVVGASLMLSIATCAFGELSILGVDVKTVISIFIVLVLGWKQGILIGATSGVTIGAVLGIIGSGEPALVASFALSGMIAGILSRFGKIGVILGFIAGNILLAYVTNGNTVSIIYLKEIVLASLGLLLVPKNVEINIEDFFDKNLYLPVGASYNFENKTDTIYKLNTVSETINEMSRNYKEEELKKGQAIENSKDAFIMEVEERIENRKDNILYEELVENKENITSDIFDILQNNGEITKEDILKLLEKRNEYVLGFEDFDTNMKIEEDIKSMARLLNEIYKIGKLNNLWKQRINENKKVISSQLDGVSKAISNVANSIKSEEASFEEEKKEIKLLCKQKGNEVLDINIKKEKSGRFIVNLYINSCKDEEKCKIEDIEKVLSKVLKDDIVLQREVCGREEQNLCKQIYMSKDRFSIQIGIAHDKKKESAVSGDYSNQTRLDDGKYLISLSDGMGSGPEARKSSQIAVKMLTRMLSSGFDRDTSMELINSSMYINSKEDMYATLDIAILDLYSGNMEFMKNGACPTFIKNKKEVTVVKSISLPAGILDKIDLVVYDKDLSDGDIIVMCSDGILESNQEYENKEIWIKNLLEEIETENVQKIANIILKESIDNYFGSAKDDMTVIVMKIKKT